MANVNHILLIRQLCTDLCHDDGKKKKNYRLVPIPTVRVINESSAVLPRAEQALSLDKGQGKHNKIYKSLGEEESQSVGKGAQEEMGHILVAPCHCMAKG